MTSSLRQPAVFNCCSRISRRCFGKQSYTPAQSPSLTTSTDRLKLAARPQDVVAELPALSILPTLQLLRNIALGSIFTRPWLFRIGAPLLSRIANNHRSFLYPERNVLMKAILRHSLYNHFCAGTDSKGVKQTISGVKALGYSGIILCPTREIMVDDKAGTHASFATRTGTNGAKEDIESWKNLYLETLSMVGKGDYVGVKYTGAGNAVTEDLRQDRDPRPEFLAALDALCERAAAQGSRLWIDAEQQALQPTINRWTVDVMRRHNLGEALVSNTYQAYLKSAPEDIRQHLHLAQNEGWTLGVKLVRGAYIASDVRERIHDTKAETDNCYNTLAEGLISRSLPGFGSEASSPDVNLFLAGHNAISISKSAGAYLKSSQAGKRVSPTRWGQLQGMADEVGCSLLLQSQRAKAATGQSNTSLEVYKCLQWGQVGECMQFLLRRAVENAGAAERMADSLKDMRRELWRRLVQPRSIGTKSG